jgi:CheY-like chemotaxis protein
MVFLDLHRAAPDGLELARQMRRSRGHRTTPLFLINDDQLPSALGIGFEAGASFFLYKPLDKDRLFKLIRATQGSMEHKRRRTRRVALQTNVRIKYGGEELEGGTVEVSLSGVLVRAARAFPRGSPVHVSLQLSNRIRPIAGARAVVRVANGNQRGDSNGPSHCRGERETGGVSLAVDSHRIVRRTDSGGNVGARVEFEARIC